MRRQSVKSVKSRLFRILLSSVIAALGFNLRAAEPEFSNHPPEKKEVRARVVIVRDPDATKVFVPQPERLPSMIERGLREISGKKTTKDAWLSFASTNDTVGIKVYSSPGNQSGTRPAVVDALIASLLSSGFSPEKVIIWDKRLVDLRLAGFDEVAEKHKVQLAAAAGSGWDEAVFYENSVLGTPVYGDFEFEKKGDSIGRKSYVSTLVTRKMTKIINVTPMLNHNYAGVTGSLLSLGLGSIDNSIRFEANADRLATAVPEIYGIPELADHVALNIVDALLCQYAGEQRSLLHYSIPLNELRFSKDAVALDVLSLVELDKQRKAAAKTNGEEPNWELYKNATLLELGISDTNQISAEISK